MLKDDKIHTKMFFTLYDRCPTVVGRRSFATTVVVVAQSIFRQLTLTTVHLNKMLLFVFYIHCS